MRRYTLQELFTLSEFNQLGQQIYHDYEAVAMNESSTGLYNDTINFVMSSVYGYFYDDLVAYIGDSKNEVRGKLYHRLGLDISIKLAYWYKKYKTIKKLLTTEDLSLLQTSKMSSSSNDTTRSAGGTLQKTATTPTGVSGTSAEDSIDITITDDTNLIATDGFVDKYTNAQQKFANANRIEGERSGEILREGSIDDLLKVLEKLPSSFAEEVQKDLQKHFVFDYDGEFEDLYDFTEGDFSGMVIGKTRTNQPVEKVEGFDTAVNGIIEEKLEEDLEFGGDVDVAGNLDVTGKIEGAEIVEKMVGYSMQPNESDENTTFDYVYGGVVKNGNKLTIAVAVNITKIGTNQDTKVVDITLPASVYNKLFPYTVGSYQYLFLGNQEIIDDLFNNHTCSWACIKIGSNTIRFSFNTTNLASNVSAYVRLEQTFLLSDNLIE